MNAVVLAATWNPRGEMERMERLLPALREVYAGLAVVLPPDAESGLVKNLAAIPDVRCIRASEWPAGRWLALQTALAFPAGAVHYVDCDRLLRWVETRPQEWQAVVARVAECECLVIGRTPAAYATHPQALVQTEAISNQVVSTFLGRTVDASAGSKGFSRRAAEFLAAHTRPGRALGTDAEWPLRLHRAGFTVEYIEVDGLDWEIPDQHQPQAASPDRQRQVAAEYDADPRHWAHRVAVAREIVEVALDTLNCSGQRDQEGGQDA
jgi:hypothetical protein